MSAASVNNGLHVMNLHSITTTMFFLVICCDARKYLSVGDDQSRTSSSHSRNSIFAAGKSLIFDEITPDNQDMPLDSSSTTSGYGVSSPSLPPYDSLAPISLPGNTPPYCLNPPVNPQSPPSTVIPPPPIGGSGGGGYATPSQPASSNPYTFPPPAQQSYPPPVDLSPPTAVYPSPAGGGGGYNFPPSPPQMGPTPATPSYSFPNPPPSSPFINVPTTSPPTYVPGPTVFLPPVVYPPPAVPPPPYIAPPMALWCVAKPSVPDPIIQEAMNYACGSGADCNQILPNGSCFSPDSLVAHASYAFNSYWQRTKVGGGTCDFGGTAILVTVDPSFDGCHFIIF